MGTNQRVGGGRDWWGRDLGKREWEQRRKSSYFNARITYFPEDVVFPRGQTDRIPGSELWHSEHLLDKESLDLRKYLILNDCL